MRACAPHANGSLKSCQIFSSHCCTCIYVRANSTDSGTLSSNFVLQQQQSCLSQQPLVVPTQLVLSLIQKLMVLPTAVDAPSMFAMQSQKSIETKLSECIAEVPKMVSETTTPTIVSIMAAIRTIEASAASLYTLAYNSVNR